MYVGHAQPVEGQQSLDSPLLVGLVLVSRECNLNSREHALLVSQSQVYAVPVQPCVNDHKRAHNCRLLHFKVSGRTKVTRLCGL